MWWVGVGQRVWVGVVGCGWVWLGVVSLLYRWYASELRYPVVVKFDALPQSAHVAFLPR